MTTFKTHNGYYLTAESGGGRELVARQQVTVDGPGPWEQFTVTEIDDLFVSIQAHDQHYVAAEVDGRVVANRSEVGPWETWRSERHDDGTVSFVSHHGGYLCAEEGGGGAVNATRLYDSAGPWEMFGVDNPWWASAPGAVARPLVGPLTIQDKLFCDDTGYRRILFCSWFPALRVLRDTPEEFYRQLDAMVAAGYQGFRTFLAVGGWTDYWDGHEVVPITFTKWHFDPKDSHLHCATDADGNPIYGVTLQAWPDYDDLLREMLRACVKRGLRLHVTCGDMQILCPDEPGKNAEIDLHRRFARICAEEGGLEVIALAEVTNEFPLNRYGGDSAESIEQMGQVIDVWCETLPGVVCAMGAIPGNEEPDILAKASTYGDTCAVHIIRDPFSMCMKHTLGVVYWEGDYRHFPKPYWEGEPAGPGDDSFCRQDDPACLTALYALHAITGQASNWFQGAAVRATAPLESEWGFLEMPTLLAVLPEDIATWAHSSNAKGGSLYWAKGQDFVSVTYEEWDPTPPRPIATWTLYTGHATASGTGTPPKGSTGLLVGTFA